MDPDAWPVKAQMGTNKEASTGALSVLSILSEEEKNKHVKSNRAKRSGSFEEARISIPALSLTATEFFMSATAEVNSLKCSSGQ